MSGRIVYVALGLSVLGLFLLTYVSLVLEPPVSRIGALDSNSIGKQVHVQGRISSVYKYKGGSISFSLNDSTGVVDVFVSYYLANSTSRISKGESADIIGELDEYKGKLEIKPGSGDSVRIVS